MSDSKKPKLSEIRAEAYLSPIHVPYLLDLVSKMGKALDAPMGHFETTLELASDTNTEFIVFWQRWLEEARALLEELEL